MKKYAIFICAMIAFVLTSCSDDEPDSFSVMVNVTYDGASASPSVVQLYDYETAKDFDKTELGAVRFSNNFRLMDQEKNEYTPRYISDTTIGVNTFENIEKGKYIVVVAYKPSGYSFANFWYYGYKTIFVNADYNAKVYWCNFKSDTKRGSWMAEFSNN